MENSQTFSKFVQDVVMYVRPKSIKIHTINIHQTTNKFSLRKKEIWTESVLFGQLVYPSETVLFANALEFVNECSKLTGTIKKCIIVCNEYSISLSNNNNYHLIKHHIFNKDIYINLDYDQSESFTRFEIDDSNFLMYNSNNTKSINSRIIYKDEYGSTDLPF